MPAAFPGNINTFVPSFEASGKLQIEFSRNPESFPLNRYVGVKTVTKGTGLYLEITAEEAARVVAQQDYEWPDGQDRPSGHDGTELFEFKPYTTQRKCYSFNLGDKAIEQADWAILASHARIHAQKAMTARADRFQTILSTTGNWGGNTDTATNLGTGQWSAATAATQYILKTMNSVKEQIHIATLGSVPPEALRMVINPELAHIMRESDEIIDYVKQNATALQTMAGNKFFERWGVPNLLYGVQVVVEDTVLVSSRKRATAATKTYMMANNIAIFTAVTEGLENQKEPAEGAPTFNTGTIFAYEDMTVESMRDPKNRRTTASVVDDTAEVLTAPASGYLVTAVV